MSNLEYDLPITPDSIFDIGSVSKQFVAFSIGLLASDGRLSLDDDVRHYVPEIPDYGQTITIRHLLTHTSGLRGVGELLGLAGWRVSDGNAGPTFAASPLLEPVTVDDVLRMTGRQKSLDFVPGAEFHYNNTGYKLLAVIVERVSGQTLRTFAEARIFRPLNMHDTQFLDDPGTIVKRHASAYQPTPSGGWRIHFSRPWALGSSGVHTSVGDLLKWEENFVAAGGRERAVLDEMQTSGRLNDGTSTNYGFGLNVGIRRDLRTVGHGGDSMGYLSEVVRYPDQHLAISVLCNASTIYPRPLADKVAEIVLGLSPPTSVVRSAPTVAVAEAELAALAGTYWNPITEIVRRFVIRDGRLIGPGGALTPIGGGRFRVGELPDPVLFPRPEPGGAQEMHILAPSRTIVHRRVVAPSYSATELSGYIGEYRSDELNVTYRIVVGAEGALAVLREKVDPVFLTPLMLDKFSGQSLGFTMTFERAPSGEVMGFTIVAATPRRLSFTRVNRTSSTEK
jgi:CubicO group peptidase (beta-lactamase class C family)